MDQTYSLEFDHGTEGEGIRFCKGTVALALSGIFVKILGMLYKIPLANLLGDEGMGYFNAAYTVYTVFFVLATSGLPVALSLMIAEEAAKGERGHADGIFRIASRLFFAVGILLTLVMALPAKGIAHLLASEKAAVGILAVSPAIAFMSYAGAVRGYFQGFRQMAPLAVSQVVEAAGKFIFGIALIYLTIEDHTLSTVAAYGILGLTFATFLAMLYLVVAKHRFRKKHPTAYMLPVGKGVTRRLLRIAFPVTVGASVTTLASSLDLFLMMRMLRTVGYTAEEAGAAFGNYSALAVPLFNMPTVLILPIAYSVLPYVRGALAKGEKEKAKEASLRALKLTATLAIPASLGLSLFAKPILSLLFRDGVSVSNAAPLLSILALAIFPLSLLTVTASLLQAYGKLWFPIGAIGLGILVKFAVTVWGIPIMGISATPYGTFLCYCLVAALDLGYLALQIGGFSLLSLCLKPLGAAIPMAIVAYFVNGWLQARLHHPTTATLATILLALCLYLAGIALTKAISGEDALSVGVPVGVVRLLKKIRIVT